MTRVAATPTFFKLVRKRLSAFALAMFLVGPPTACAQTYRNPVLDENFPDPTVFRIGDTTYAYATGGEPRSGNPTPYIRMSRSTDLVHWTPSVTVMAPPAWARGSTWAPHVVKDPRAADRYVMFFSAQADAARADVPDDADKCLGVAVARSPEGPFTPQPHPLRCGPGFFNIDPIAFYDQAADRFVLYWGSARRAIAMQPLAPDLLTFVPGSQPHDVIAPIPGDKYANLIEGSWVLDHGGYRYLFLSGSNCCDGPDGYAVTVARKRLGTDGPWVRYTGGDHGAILRRNARWVAPGHNTVFVDRAGTYWIMYHARRPDDASKRVLMIDRITWTDDWPRIASDSPSTGTVPAPVP